FDGDRPSVALTTDLPARTGANPITFKATFSEAVTGFAASDVSVTNGTVNSVAATDTTNRVFTISVTPTANGDVTVSIPENGAQDAAGNGNTASNTLTRTFDSVPPTVNLTTTAGTSTTTAPIAFTALFSEAASG